MDGLISGFGEQACFCHSDAAGCGAEKREADRQQAQVEIFGIQKNNGDLRKKNNKSLILFGIVIKAAEKVTLSSQK